MTKSTGSAEPRRVAAKNFGNPGEVEFFDILAHESAGGGVVVYEQTETGPPGQGFNSKCPGAGEEALVIALLLRQALETPGRRAALVTPDRALARRCCSRAEGSESDGHGAV